MTRRLTPCAAVLATVLWCGAAAAADGQAVPAETPATQPAATQPGAPADLIRRLGDADPATRDAASRALWALGRSAEPALRAAADGDDPEIARRARAILRDFTYGLYPDAPRELFALLEDYRRGRAREKRLTVLRLAGQGVPGLRVLLKLRHDERDPMLRQVIEQVLLPREHQVAVLMVAEGQSEELREMLEQSARESGEAAQDYAALMLLDGKIGDALSRAKATPATAASAALLVPVARAAGDAPFARALAERSGNPDLLDAVLTEQGDWATLARRVSADPERMTAPERLGYLCAYGRLSGDAAQADRAAAQLVAHADAVPDEYTSCAENLFLNDHADEATAILLRHDNFVEAADFLAPRLQFPAALELPKLAEQYHSPHLLEVKARSIAALHFVGRMDEARRMMDEVASGNRSANDFGTWVALIEAARALNQPDRADAFAADALGRADVQAPVGWLFETMGYGDGASAMQWWQFFRRQLTRQDTATSIRQLRHVMQQSVTAADLQGWAGEARRYGAELPAESRDEWEETFADSLVRGGLIDLAAEWYRQLAARSHDPRAQIKAGDFEAARSAWPAAVERYARAWELDHTSATALFFEGWATARAGDERRGRNLMELAHRLPLGGAADRVMLMDALLRHDLHEDARREMDLILKATPVRSFERNEAMRRLAEEVGGRGDELAAAELWDRAFLPNLSDKISFNQPWANVIVPALVHKARAVGLIKAGRVEDGLREANIALRDTPSDADALIDVIKALDASGDRPQADALFKSQTAIYRKLIADYPESGPAHNQLAWAQVKCERELNDALANATRAVELEPDSTASRDTLAEVYFARGDVDRAIDQIKQCLKLEPHVEHHLKQLARFEAAAAAQRK